jgi:hypothetical protein
MKPDLYASELIEQNRYANGIELPDEVFEHPVIQEIMRISLDLVILYVNPIPPGAHSLDNENSYVLGSMIFYPTRKTW